MRLLPQNTIPLPAVSVRQGRHGHSRMPHHNQPTGPETDRCVLPGSAALRQSHFLWKCFFFRNMAIFVQLRKIFPEPFLRKVKFIVHKAVPVAPPQKQGIRRAGSLPFCPGGRSTGASPRRDVSLFSQNTYHLRTAYRGPAQPVWKAVPGKYPGGAVPQKGL